MEKLYLWTFLFLLAALSVVFAERVDLYGTMNPEADSVTNSGAFTGYMDVSPESFVLHLEGTHDIPDPAAIHVHFRALRDLLFNFSSVSSPFAETFSSSNLTVAPLILSGHAVLQVHSYSYPDGAIKGKIWATQGTVQYQSSGPNPTVVEYDDSLPHCRLIPQDPDIPAEELPRITARLNSVSLADSNDHPITSFPMPADPINSAGRPTWNTGVERLLLGGSWAQVVTFTTNFPFFTVALQFALFDSVAALEFGGREVFVPPDANKLTVFINGTISQPRDAPGSHVMLELELFDAFPSPINGVREARTQRPGSTSLDFTTDDMTLGVDLVQFAVVDGRAVPAAVTVDGSNTRLRVRVPTFDASLVYDPNFAVLVGGAPADGGSSDVSMLVWIGMIVALVTAGVVVVVVILLIVKVDAVRDFAFGPERRKQTLGSIASTYNRPSTSS
eukprot:CAMPEP_0177664068 /NCGR_PEP_ID=MMETSP0447-20121125/20279_1 /TAXON_ID=0 /ORGANISM="Stygamoeba regulata, Strain BSH-02190019" /LENGTH=445 /DNA_ID=CAMNT_0019169981 /DNA_START=217 /DNA_END=1554 /DNA_ORIENTATION=+